MALAVAGAIVNGVSIVTGQTGLTVRALGVVGTVTLAGLVVAVASEWVTVSVTLTGHTAASSSQSRAKTARATVLTVWASGPVLAFITDPRCSDACGVEIAATVDVTFNTTQNQGSRIGGPAKRALALETWTSTALALTTLIVTGLITVQRAVPGEPSFTMALIRCWGVDAGGKGVAVM